MGNLLEAMDPCSRKMHKQIFHSITEEFSGPLMLRMKNLFRSDKGKLGLEGLCSLFPKLPFPDPL
jgi:hypothetical protein